MFNASIQKEKQTQSSTLRIDIIKIKSHNSILSQFILILNLFCNVYVQTHNPKVLRVDKFKCPHHHQIIEKSSQFRSKTTDEHRKNNISRYFLYSVCYTHAKLSPHIRPQINKH